MLTRREFLHAAGAGALAASSAPRLLAAKYELLIKGGRVIDPGQRLDRIMDVAIGAGRIADLRANIPVSDAAEVIDAGGKLVTPGLIDIHLHLVDSTMPPAYPLSTGVTSMIEAGSRGADNFGDVLSIARAAPNRVRVLLNLARQGIGRGELLDLANADVDAARRAIDANRDVIVGMKARLSRPVAGENDLEAVRRARLVTAPLNLPLMVHVGQTFSPLPAIVALLGRGDIVTHMYSPPPNGILDQSGRVFPEILEARRRGVIFDVGNGRNGHITWEVAQRAMEQGFLPDTISSDLTEEGRTDRVIDLPNVLSKFLLLGMPVDRVIASATANAALAMPAFKGLGTLRAGVPADVAVFELKDGDFEFVDSANTKRIGHQKLMPYAVIAAGTRVR